MLKCVLFLLSEYYYKIVRARLEEICENLSSKQVQVELKKLPSRKESASRQEGAECFTKDLCKRSWNIREVLVITDEPKAADFLLEGGWYVVALYHEENRSESFSGVRYGIEDVFALEYQSYEAAYKRLAGLPWDILETERLLVREGTVEDVEAYYRIYSDPSVTLYMEDLYEDRNLERDYMKAYIDQIYGFYGYGLWSVILKETGQVIGRAGLSVRQGYDLPELGFVIDRTYQNRGYGYEVCAGILAYAKKELDFEQIQALTHKDNLISKRLLRKLGFVFEREVSAEYRDHELFIKKI